MARYRVTLVTSASTSVEVEADSPEQAREAAWEADTPTLCHQCSGYGREYNLELGDDWDIPKDGKLSDYVEEIDGEEAPITE